MYIMFLEEEERARIGLVRLLERRGHTVDEFATADDAVLALKKNRYDLLILDIVLDRASTAMPDVQMRELGKELLVRLRARHFHGLSTETDVPVTVITAVADHRVRDDIMHASNTLVLFKPIDPEDALFRIESFCSGFRQGNAHAG